MSMSKKDFQALAVGLHAAFREFGDSVPDTLNRKDTLSLCLNQVIANVADACRASNPLFDRGRFLEACTTGRCRGMKAK